MRRVVAVALIVAVVTAAALVPRKAQAVDDLVYIIPAAVSGVIIVAVVVAIMVADRSKDEDLDLVASVEPRQPSRGIQFGPACRRPTGEVALFCW
jgi:hypothetical protein